MGFFHEELGQGGAEYLLIFGGIIVIAIAAIMLYFSYFSGIATNGTADVTIRFENLQKKMLRLDILYMKSHLVENLSIREVEPPL